MVLQNIQSQIEALNLASVEASRRLLLDDLATAIQQDLNTTGAVNIQCICTHNSRRSMLAQVWAQTMAHYFGIKTVVCFSGGTEATAPYAQIVETLKFQGFVVHPIEYNEQEAFEVRYSDSEAPITLFSKVYNETGMNPSSNFIAVLTCSQVANDCPVVQGASHRFALTYTDPKQYDNSPLKAAKYLETSNLIALEWLYIFSKIKR